MRNDNLIRYFVLAVPLCIRIHCGHCDACYAVIALREGEFKMPSILNRFVFSPNITDWLTKYIL